MTKKKTKKPKEIPDAYQFTSEDIDWYWDNFHKLGGLDTPKPEATEQELYFFNLVDQADRLSRFLKRMPTMGELRRWWHSEAEEHERRRLASWQPNYRFNEKDLVEYEALLARKDTGPFMNFMSVVAHLKQSTGNFPTVSEIRAEQEEQERRNAKLLQEKAARDAQTKSA
jgi:hypothetical protein